MATVIDPAQQSQATMKLENVRFPFVSLTNALTCKIDRETGYSTSY